MLDTPYNRHIQSKIRHNVARHINHEKLKDSGLGHHLDKLICSNCGHSHFVNHDSVKGGKIGKINWGHVGNQFKTASKNIGKGALEIGGSAAGTALGVMGATAMGNPELAPIAGKLGSMAGSQAGKAVGNSLFGAGMRKRKSTKGSKSKTHPGEKDYTTKKGDRTHHIDNHYVYEELMPYAIRGGYAPIAAKSIAQGITGGKLSKRKSSSNKKTSPWISHVKAFSKKHGINYSQALSHPDCKASYHR
jgi:hypothetical protein